MPLLPAEPYIYPDNLLTAPETENRDSRWWVMHTRPRAEKALVRRLVPHAIPFFLPQQEHRRRSGGRTLTSHLPLFPGYVFVRTDAEGRSRVLETNCVAGCLPVPDPGRLRSDLERVHRLMTSDVPLETEERLQPGITVEITHGCLAGMRGTLLGRGDRLKFYVEVELIRQGVSVEVERWMFEPVGRREPVGTS